MSNYTVVRGDTLSGIASAHGITLKELLAVNPQFTTNGRNPNLIYPGENVNIPAKSPASTGSPSSPTSGSKPTSTGGSSKSGCTSCTISSQTVATSPANRARKRIAVGEEVKLTVTPGPASWSITSGAGTLNPSRGSHTSVTYTAGDAAGSVTITASPSGCSCTITFTVVAPSSWTMKQKAGTNLRHTDKRPDCGWKGILYVHPNDVNFYNIETREKDSKYDGTGSYISYKGDYHGNYPPPDRVSAWITITGHSTVAGSNWGGVDTIYTGDPGATVTGAAPPFKVGSGHFPITMQWKVGTGTAKDFTVARQEDQIFSDGKCESRKGGNTEKTKWNDPASTY